MTEKKKAQARIFLVEDHKELGSTYEEYFKAEGWIVFWYKTLGSALEWVASIEDPTNLVAVIDANLGSGITDGEEVAYALRDKFKDVHIIGNSGIQVEWSDVEGSSKDDGPDGVIENIKDCLKLK